MKTCQRTALISMTCLALLAPWSANAQGGYPNKPIRVIVPFAAGSTTDIIARAISDKMSQSMGQPLVIDNRGGASGTIGQQAVATAAADGYTIMIHSSSHTVSPSTFAKLPFDTVNDFAAVTPISSTPNVLVMSPTKNIKTLQELLTAARAKAAQSARVVVAHVKQHLEVGERGARPLQDRGAKRLKRKRHFGGCL